MCSSVVGVCTETCEDGLRVERAQALITATPPRDQQALALTFPDDNLFSAAPTFQVLRGMPNGEGPKLVEQADGIDAMKQFQFHENEDLRNMANGLVDKYFGLDYGLEAD
ncbi:hypothetical protein ACFE04_020258 [Oxalis oulophora]